MLKRIKQAIEETKSIYGLGVSMTYQNFSNELNKLFVDREFFDDKFFENFEEKLIELDVMPTLAMIICSKVEEKIYSKKVIPEEFYKAVNEVIKEVVNLKQEELVVKQDILNMWLVVGVNGVGKTTSISKLAHKFKEKSILLVAADTFRAGAIEQLNEWANWLDVPIVKTHQGHAPSAVIYNGLDEAINQDVDLLICDTAGRLHNKDNLMEELKKIHKIIEEKVDQDKELKTILVLDGTAGKNTIEQAKEFNKITNIDGVIITKLDSGGKAGMILNVVYELDVPIYFLTTGEKVEDIKAFDTNNYITALFSNED
ncbi:MAG: signal recognition particle-docking protein FtsY [Mycoplasmatales bacterium]